MQTCRSDRTYSPCVCGADVPDGGDPFDGGIDLGPTPIDLGTDFGTDLGRDSGGPVITIPDQGIDMREPGCGDGTCDSPDEDIFTCPEDCSFCGDGYCLTGEVGSCTVDCDCSVEGPDSCAADARCIPTRRMADYSLRGACTPFGSVAEGAACVDLTECMDGLGCFPEDDGMSYCNEECDPLWRQSGASPCSSAGEACVARDMDWVVGSCDAGCTVGTTTGCPAGEWCEPGLVSRGGFCTVDGPNTEGDACTTGDDCGIGTFCTTRGRCARVCDPAAATTGCAASQHCAPFFLEDPSSGNVFASPVGSCMESCDYDAGGTCTRGICMAGELFRDGRDFCLENPELNPGDPCDFPGAMETSFCNGLGACYDIGSGLTCFPFCRESEGAFGSAHPDCETGEVCNGMAGDVIGFCV